MCIENIVSILSICIGVLTALVAFVTIIFGYNLLIFQKSINKEVDKLKKQTEKSLCQISNEIKVSLNNAMKLSMVQNDIDKFIEHDVKDCILTRQNRLMNVVLAIESVANIENPYVSASILNQLYKILIGIGKDTNAFEIKDSEIYNYDFLSTVVDKNIKIVEQNNMSELLFREKNGDFAIRDAVRGFLDFYANPSK